MTKSSSWKRPINPKEWNQRNHAVKEEANHLLGDRLPQLLGEVVAATGAVAKELRKERERQREAPSAAAAAAIAAATSEKARYTRAFVDTCNKLLSVAVHRERLGQEQPPSVPPLGTNGGAMTGPEAQRWRRDDAKARAQLVAEADASADEIYRAVLRAQETVFGAAAEEVAEGDEGGDGRGGKRRRGHATWSYTAHSVPAISQFAKLRRRQGRHAEAVALLQEGLRMRCVALGVDERGELASNNERPSAEETALLSSSFAEVGLGLVRKPEGIPFRLLCPLSDSLVLLLPSQIAQASKTNQHGKASPSEEVLEYALSTMTRSCKLIEEHPRLGPRSPAYASALMRLAAAERDCGRRKDSEQTFRKASEIFRGSRAVRMCEEIPKLRSESGAPRNRAKQRREKETLARARIKDSLSRSVGPTSAAEARRKVKLVKLAKSRDLGRGELGTNAFADIVRTREEPGWFWVLGSD